MNVLYWLMQGLAVVLGVIGGVTMIKFWKPFFDKKKSGDKQ